MATESNWSTRKYGRLSGQDYEDALSLYRQADREGAELVNAALKHRKSGKPLLAEGFFPWAPLYKYPLEQLLSGFLKLSGKLDLVEAAATAGNPTVEFVSLMQADLDTGEVDLAVENPGAIIGITIAVEASLFSISVYSRSMPDLIADLDNPDLALRSLCRALRIDSTVIAHPKATWMLLEAQVSKNIAAQKKIYAAIKSHPNRSRLKLVELRWLEYLLWEAGAFEYENCSREDIHDLVVNGLRLYDEQGKKQDSFKGLFKLFNEWGKGRPRKS